MVTSWWAQLTPAACSLCSQFNPCSLNALLHKAVLQQLQHEHCNTRPAHVAVPLTHLSWLPTALRPTFSAQPACPPLWPPPSLAGPAQVLQGWSQPGPGRKRLEAERPSAGAALLNPNNQGLAMSWENVLEGSRRHSLTPDAVARGRQERARGGETTAGAGPVAQRLASAEARGSIAAPPQAQLEE